MLLTTEASSCCRSRELLSKTGKYSSCETNLSDAAADGRAGRGTAVVGVDVAFADIENRADAAKRADLAGEQVDNAQPRRCGLVGPSDDDAIDRNAGPHIRDEERQEFPGGIDQPGQKPGRGGRGQRHQEVAQERDLRCLGFREEGIRRVDEAEEDHQQKMDREHKKRRREDQLEIPDMLGAEKAEQRRCRFRRRQLVRRHAPHGAGQGPERQPREQPGDQVVSHGTAPAVARAPLQAGRFVMR